MNLASLDLNLLIPLDALLRQRSVTMAAASLGLGQPALSASLKRLRRHFGDELLTRSGNRYELTPLAVRLQKRTELALSGVERVFESEPVFDPATSRRTFRVLGSDYAMAVLGGPVGRIMSEHAPGMRLRFGHHSTAVIDAAAEHLRSVDALVFPHGFIKGLPHQDLHSDRWVCLVSSDNTRVGSELKLEDLAALQWVLNYHSSSTFTLVTRQLQMMGIDPAVQVVVESFLAMPHFIAGTDRIGLIHAHLASQLTRAGDVRALPFPGDMVPLVQALWWHPMHQLDREHWWLRAVFAECGRALTARSEGGG